MSIDIETSFVAGTPRLAFDHLGSGDPVIFLHGIGGNRTNWATQLPVFARHFHAIAWDARGWGLSDDYEGPLHFENFSEDLLRLMEHFHLHTAHFVGLSMGGLILQDFIGRHPERIRTLVLADTSRGPLDDHDEAWVDEFLAMRKKPLLEGKSTRDIAPWVARALAGPQASPETLQVLAQSIADLHPDSYLKAMDCVMRYRIPTDRSRIQVPVLVLVGDEDRLTPVAAARSLAGSIPTSHLVTLPGAGHLANIEQPAAFNQTVLEFLLQPHADGGGGGKQGG